MNHRVIPILLFVLSLLGILFGYFLMHPDLVGLCPKNLDANCLSESINFGIGSPLYWSTRLLPLLFLVLIFVRKEVFTAWWKVTVWFALVAMYFIVTAPPLPALLTPDRTEVTDFMVKVVVIVSAVVVAWKYYMLSRTKASKAK